MGIVKTFLNNWVFPKEAPRCTEPGEIHILTPGGKIEVSARITSSADARDMKKVLDILLNKAEENFDFEEFIGKTD